MDLSPHIQKLRGQLLADPTFLPQKLDLLSERVLFVNFTPDAYRQASFLDDRILSPESRGMWARFDDVSAAVGNAAPARPLHFIFHAGHVGSTLASRLLEGAGGVLAVREPLPLRTLAEIHDGLNELDSLISPARFNGLLHDQVVLWSRGYADTRAVVVKATSAAARIGPALMQARTDARALYLYLPLEPYLATLMAGENSPIDLRGLAGERIRRLRRFGVEPPAPLHAMSIGELAALGWAAERLSQSALTEACGGSALSVDFERLIAAPEPTLRAICSHFRLEATDDYFREIANDPAWSRYAKAPEHAYSPELRAQLLSRARTAKAEEIRRGLSWFDALAAKSPRVAALAL